MTKTQLFWYGVMVFFSDNLTSLVWWIFGVFSAIVTGVLIRWFSTFCIKKEQESKVFALLLFFIKEEMEEVVSEDIPYCKTISQFTEVVDRIKKIHLKITDTRRDFESGLGTVDTTLVNLLIELHQHFNSILEFFLSSDYHWSSKIEYFEKVWFCSSIGAERLKKLEKAVERLKEILLRVNF